MTSQLEAGTELAFDSLPLLEHAVRGPKARRTGGAVAAALVAGLAAAALVVCLRARRSGDVGLRLARGSSATVSFSEVPEGCGGAGDNCHASKCCRDGGTGGLQCYAKNEFWAECSETCEKGVRPGEKMGTYDQYGHFQAQAWTCEELGRRSHPDCSTFPREKTCPAHRCMWKGACLSACHTYPDEGGCGTNDKCMWKGSCLEACETLPSQEVCLPTDKCAWKSDKCVQGCWSFGTWDACSKIDRCIWDGAQCQDNCWTHASADECSEHDNLCMWHGDKCQPACKRFSTADSCPKDAGCHFVKQPLQAPACLPDPCSMPGEDCRSTRCCSAERGAAGMTCFEKDDTWASCAATCDPASSGLEDWTCAALGNRTSYPTGCSWAGDDCQIDRLCCNVGFQCKVKDDVFTGCVQTVMQTTWVTKQVPLPAGWKGDFVGPGRAEYSVAAAGDGQPVAGTSLYCFMAILPDSSEVPLMQLAKRNKASIFGCDAFDVFHSWQSAKAGWDTGESTLTNTDVFVNVMQQVHNAGKYLKFDWTVKVDADALLLPDRLKAHISALRPPANRGIYLKNNNMDKGLGNSGFLGAVEVFSQMALQVYFDNADGCVKSLGFQAGEDGFFKGCMDALGVGFMTDAHMFFPDISAGVCNAQERAAFHPLKAPVDWQCCLDITSGTLSADKVKYGKCELGYDLDLNFDDDGQ